MVDIVDVTLHTAVFPSTYIGKGTLIGNPYQAADVPERINLKLTSTGNAISIPVGFVVTSVKVINVTDGFVWEWLYGMPVANSIKTTLGTVAAVQDTTSQIVVSPAVSVNGNQTVTLGAALAAATKALVIQIEG